MKRIAMVALLFAGCSLPLAEYTIATTENAPIKATKGRLVEGKDCLLNILGIPVGSLAFRQSRAVGNALRKANDRGQKANALRDVRIDATAWSAIFFGQDCIVVKGEAINIEGKN